MSSHEENYPNLRVWCQGGDTEKVREDQGRTETDTLLRQVTKEVTALAYQARRLKETKD